MKTACIQLRCGTDIDKNIAEAAALIRAAHRDGARFIATPENTLLIEGNTKALFESIQTEPETKAVGYFSNLAKELGIDLLIGSMAIRLSDRKAANRSFVFGPDGKIKARYDKMHMFDVEINAQETWRESANYTAGDSSVITDIGATNPGFKLGLSICYDLRFAALYKYYVRHGANIMAVPAAFTPITGAAHWEVLLRARAIETASYVIAPAQGGKHNPDRQTWGHSLMVDPWGQIVAKLDGDKPGYCIADLSLSEITKRRRQIPAWSQETNL